MKWTQVREQYPEQWVLVEAISAYSKNSIRYPDELSVISNFPESTLAWKAYKKLHLADPSREYYISIQTMRQLKLRNRNLLALGEGSSENSIGGWAPNRLCLTWLQRKETYIGKCAFGYRLFNYHI